LSDLRIDSKDLQILKILVNNCRTSYRSIGQTLGISTNTAKKRVNNLVSSKVIEQFTTVLNFSILGYESVLSILLRYDNDKGKDDDIEQRITKYLEKWGNVYIHICAIGGFSAFGVALKGRKSQTKSNDIIGSLRKDLLNGLGRNILLLDLFAGEPLSEISKNFKLLEIDLKIMRCLLADPRMNYLDIAKKVSSSQRTIIRRFEKLLSNHIIINFGIIHNPSKMKGYNYFSIIVKTEVGQSMDVMKQITYSELNNYILRLASFNFENAIIINFHSENVLDIESILNKVKTFYGVKKVDAFQPSRIRLFQDWIRKEIDTKLQNMGNAGETRLGL
jgi:Lrp/AsnC family transcriptional regulator for asnA, asnC and gidA